MKRDNVVTRNDNSRSRGRDKVRDCDTNQVTCHKVEGCLCYVDDILVGGRDIDDHLDLLEQVHLVKQGLLFPRKTAN